MPLALAIALCLGSGDLVVGSVWPSGRWGDDLLLRFSLSVGFGVGIFSVVFFLARVFNIERVIAIDLLVVALLVAVFILHRIRASKKHKAELAVEDFNLPGWLHRLLVTSFAVSLCATLYSAILRAIAHPPGDGWDAFAIWNLHARFLYRGGMHWRDGFSALIPWSHPDYPLLLPAAIAHFWTYLGHDDPAVPAFVGVAFTFGTLGLLYSSLVRLRGRNAAMLGGLALSSTPFFVEQGTSQYADVPLSFFFLAVIALLCLYEHSEASSRGLLILSGVACGFAAWTKNEGLLFVFAAIAARLIFYGRKSREMPDPKAGRGTTNWITLGALLLAMAPILLLVAGFKHFVAPTGDLFSSPAVMLHRVLVPARYGAIMKWYAKEFFRFGHWWIVPSTVLLAVLYFTRAAHGTRQLETALRTSVWTLALTLAGYFAIYLITPYDIFWHLRFSLSRLFLQLWPSAVFLFFAFVPTSPS